MTAWVPARCGRGQLTRKEKSKAWDGGIHVRTKPPAVMPWNNGGLHGWLTVPSGARKPTPSGGSTCVDPGWGRAPQACSKVPVLPLCGPSSRDRVPKAEGAPKMFRRKSIFHLNPKEEEELVNPCAHSEAFSGSRRILHRFRRQDPCRSLFS